mmetsp:Transcript_99814/g.180165  ORF Transcript_99814/g.180165 Transcript_99814/m.180165 type:complete len:359 (-) Transcript_99814:79-1155(-)
MLPSTTRELGVLMFMSGWKVPLMLPSTTHKKGAASREIPADPLQEQRSQLSQFSSLLVALDSCIENSTSAVAQLQEAPRQLLQPLQRMQYSPANAQVASLVAELGAQAQKLHAGMHDLKELGAFCKQVQKRVSEAEEALERRDAQWEAKAHYDGKVEALQTAASTSEARLVRNQQKQRSSARAFLEGSEAAERAVTSINSQSWNLMAAALSKLCNCYGTVLEASGGSPKSRVLPSDPRLQEAFSSPPEAAHVILRDAKVAERGSYRLQAVVGQQRKVDGVEELVQLPTLMTRPASHDSSPHRAQATTQKTRGGQPKLGHGLLSDDDSVHFVRKESGRSTGSNGSWLRCEGCTDNPLVS